MAKIKKEKNSDLKDTGIASLRDNSIVNMSENTKAHTQTGTYTNCNLLSFLVVNY